MGFQRMIHAQTFPLMSKQPQDALNPFHMSNSQRETARSLGTAFFAVHVGQRVLKAVV